MQPYAPPPGSPYGPGAFGPPPGYTANPFYAAPAAAPIRPAGRGGFALKWVAVAGYAMLLSAGTAMIATAQGGDRARGDVLVFVGLAMAVGVNLWTLGGLGWVYASWAYLPPEYRRNAAGRAISPLAAVGWQFVPIYNIYWVFVQNLGYCEAVDAVMMASGRTARAPKNLATMASVLYLVPYLNMLVAPLVWMAYMFSMDAVKAELREPVR